MNTVRLFSRQTKAIAVIAMLLAATILPSLAFAATITTRSIALSSSSKAATGVTYEVKFTAVNTATGFVVDFCSNSPLIGQVCDAPEGLSVLAATSADSTKDTDETTANKFVGTKSISTGEQTITLTGVKNPDDAGTIYARIVTFNADGQENYDSTTTGANNPGAHVDEGSVAIAITDSVAVSGAVLESLTFCLSKVAIPKDCDTEDEGANIEAPVLRLGEDNGGVIALDTGHVSWGEVSTQLSTNAVGGVVVWLKSSAAGCGGLLRAGEPDPAEACGIAPAQNTGILAGEAKFGVRTAASTDSVGVDEEDAIGVLQPNAATNYNNSTYVLNYNDTTSGVTSIFGDSFLNTNDAPANNKNMVLRFAASISNNTPAGLYSANLSLIATGKF